ncbi:MAG: hypothetical protein ISS72_08240 [Candidatus Brocadiae bacterium]|nr:hypothetical protein [Candidatus Brocadiia bacterium]
MRMRAVVGIAALVLLAPAMGEGAGQPWTVEIGDARLTVGGDGRWTLAIGGEAVVADARLVVASPKWKSNGGQETCRVEAGYPRTEGAACVVRGDIVMPAPMALWRFEQRVEPAGKAVRVSYRIEPLADTTVAEVSLFLSLPIERWRGRKVTLWPQSEAAFPATQPPNRHFLTGRPRRVVLGLTDARRIALDFGRPVQCTVQDTREFKGSTYQIYPRLFAGGAARKGQVFRLAFTLNPNELRRDAMASTDYSSRGPLRIGAVKLSAATVPLYARLEADLEVGGTWATPFDADQIRVDGHVTAPSGRTLVVPAFFSQDHELARDGDDAWIEPGEKRGWKLRLAVTEPGRHSLVVVARDKSGEARSKPVAFEATPSDDPGYIRVSTKDRRYFEFGTGRPYFAVGENVCTWRKGVQDYDTWFPNLGKAGGNFARIWMWGHCFGIEWGKPGQYRMDHAWALDHAMELAEKHGIYVKLCLEAWRGFSGRKCFVKPGVIHPYAKANGGPCATEMDVFTDPEARRMFRNRLRYCVARWGYSTHILAWEFWNEINCVFGYRGREQDMIAWTAEMARYLKQIDPWQHLVTNSLGSFQVDDRLWKLADIDFAQVHGYWHPTLPASKELGKDMAAMVPEWLGRIEHYGKPRLFAEYGLVNATWGHSPRADEDKEGVHLHNGLWSATMTGACGTAMLWWWGNYVEPNGLYPRFASVAKFVDGVPWTSAGFHPVQARASTPQFHVLGLQGKALALLWLHNRRHTWWNVVEKQPIPPVEGATVTVSGLADGDWQVEWWDTWKGTVARRETLTARGGALTLAPPRMARDVAVKLRPAR